MEFQEYPKRIYKGNESIVVNTKAEENNFLGIITDDKVYPVPTGREKG